MESELLAGKKRIALVRDACTAMTDDGVWKVDSDLMSTTGGFCGHQKACFIKESGFWKVTYRCGIVQASEENDETMNDFYTRLTDRSWQIVGADMMAVFDCYDADEVLKCVACRNECFGADARKKPGGVELFIKAVEKNFPPKQGKNINGDIKKMDDNAVIKLRESLVEMGFNDVQGD